jgi:transcriptional regulator with XRE-family HTH domain
MVPAGKAPYRRSMPADAAESIRDWLAREMLRRQLSQRALAERSGVDHSTISRILSSERGPAWATVARLAGALGSFPPSLSSINSGSATDAQIRRALTELGLSPEDVDAMVVVYRRRQLHDRRVG